MEDLKSIQDSGGKQRFDLKMLLSNSLKSTV